MDKSSTSATEDSEISACVNHKGTKYYYCKTCQLYLCDDCYPSHNDKKHEIKDAVSLATKCKEKLAKHKEELNGQIKAGLSWMQKYYNETQSSAEKSLNDLEIASQAFIKNIMKDARDRKSQIISEVQKSLKSLEDLNNNSNLQNGFENEFEILEKILSSKDESLIITIKKSDLDQKAKMQKTFINNLLQNTNKTKEKLNGFIRDCRETIEIFDVWENNSVAKLTSVYESKLNEIKEREDQLYEKSQQLYRQLLQNSDSILENNILFSEKTDIKSKIDQNKTKNTELNIEIDKAIQKNNELEHRINILSQTIKEKTNDLQNIETAIKLRQDFLTNLSKKEHTNSTVQVKLAESNLLQQASVIYIFDQKLFGIFVYHIEMKKTAIIKGAADFGVASNHDSVQIKNDLYISGGFDTSKVQFSKAMIKLVFIDLDNIKPEQKQEMLIAKSQHKLVMLNPTTIYCLGGKSKEKKFLNHCEKYDITENKWEKAPPLKEEKLNISATALNEIFIYAFGGFNGNYSTSIEVLNTQKLTDGWKIVKLEKASGWVGKDEAGCFQISGTELMIFGGINGSEGCTEDVFVFNTEKRTIVKHAKKLCKKDWFTMRTPIRLYGGSAICIAGYFLNDLHFYDTAKMTWSVVEQKEWRHALK